MYCDNGVMQGRDLKGQEHKSFFEIDDILPLPVRQEDRGSLLRCNFPPYSQ